MFTTGELILYFYLPALILIYLTAYFIYRRNRRDVIRVDQSRMPGRTYQALRHQILSRLRQNVPTIPPATRTTEPYAVLMDWPLSKGIATVVAVADGTASVYLSGGGGFLGGGQSNEKIRQAAHRAVSIASEFQPQMRPTKEFPLPEAGWINFYAVSDAGVFTASAPESELRNRHHSLSNLGDVMQAIVTQYRLMPPALTK